MAKPPVKLSFDNVAVPLLLCGGHAAFLASQAPGIISRYHETGTVLADFPTIVVVTATYAAVVLALKASHARKAKAAEKEGKPLVLTPLFNTAPAMLVYNMYMSALSLLMAVGFAVDFVNLGTWRWNQARPAHPAGVFTAYTIWVNYISKPTEFVDTFFMFANGKPEQASLLHVSHHIVMPLVMYAGLQYPGGNSGTGPFINSVVHTLMYAYYGVTAARLCSVPMWIKRSLTQLQLVQFVIILAHASYGVYTGYAYWPWEMCWITIALMFQMLWLFSSFFLKAYCSKREKRTGTSEAAATKQDKSE